MTDSTPAAAVLVTGAGGVIGQRVTARLQNSGREVIALIGSEDATPVGMRVIRGDAADPEVARAAADEVIRVGGGGPTAVIHLAAIPHPTTPTARGFVNNTAAAFAVVEAAGEGGVDRAVMASSMAALGFAFGPAGLRPEYLPVDEKHPQLVEDSYGLSKAVTESIAASMGRRWGIGTCALRLPFVAHGERLDRRIAEAHTNPEALRAELWSYLHTDDAAEFLIRAADADLRGHQIVNVAAPDTLSDEATKDLIARFLPDVTVRAEITGHDVPWDLTRLDHVIGARPRRTWRDGQKDGES